MIMNKVFTISKLDDEGNITIVSRGVLGDKSIKECLVNFLEYFINKNANTWEYFNSGFNTKVKKSKMENFFYTHTNEDIYYIVAK